MEKFVIVNFKCYSQGTGKNALKLAKLCEKVSKKEKITIIPAVQAADIRLIASKINIPVFCQHIDANSYGSFTGAVTAESVKKAGAKGTLLNHSEKRLKKKIIKKTIEQAKKNNLITVLCVKDVREVKKYKKFNPDYIAIEPPELIGGDISVSTAKPKIISKAAKALQGSSAKLICGAGVKNSTDVKKAYELGSKGILVASGIMKSKNVEKALIDLCKGFK